MSAKENFNKAVYDMFGVGKEEEKKVANTGDNAKQPAAPAPQEMPAAQPAHAVNKPTYLAAGVSLEGILRVKGDIEIAGDIKGELIGDGSVVLRSDINGNVTAKQLSMVGCKVTGDVHVDGLVLIDNKSSMEGNLFVDSLECAGRVKGDVNAKNHTAFHSTARMEGNVSTGSFTVERGAVLSGNIKMGTQDTAKAAEPAAQK